MFIDFWAVVAQSVPVIALALVIEARTFARRVRRKKDFVEMRVERVTFAITTTVAAILLLVAFSTSLAALTSEKSLSTPWTSVAVFCIAVSLGAVFVNPLFVLLPALTSDVREERRMNSERRKTLKAAKVLRSTLTQGEGVLRDRNLSALSNYADNYTVAMRTLRRSQGDSPGKGSAASRALVEYLDELDAWRVAHDAHQLEGRKALDEGYALLRQAEDRQRVSDFGPYIRNLRSLID